MHTLRLNHIGAATHWKLVGVTLLSALSFTNAKAQTEMPNQWLDAQMLAAQLDRTTLRGESAVATATKAVKPTTAAPTALAKDAQRSTANAASSGVPAQK